MTAKNIFRAGCEAAPHPSAAGLTEDCGSSKIRLERVETLPRRHNRLTMTGLYDPFCLTIRMHELASV